MPNVLSSLPTHFTLALTFFLADSFNSKGAEEREGERKSVCVCVPRRLNLCNCKCVQERNVYLDCGLSTKD